MCRVVVVLVCLCLLLSGCIFGEESNPTSTPSANNTSNNCTPESDQVLCGAISAGRCGSLMAKDSCGATRQLECGCAGNAACEEGVCVGSCQEPPDGVAAACQRQGATCGMIQAPSACAQEPVMISCGTCAFGQACESNVCGVTRLLPPLAKGQLQFGAAVSAHAKRVAVGAPGADIDGAPRKGAVYVFTPSPTGWVASSPITQVGQPARLGGRNERFGESVALFGEWLAVGAHSAAVDVDGTMGLIQQAGAVYLYKLEGQEWVFKQRLVSDAPAGGGLFGLSVAMDGERLVVGEPSANFVDVLFRGAKGRAHIFQLRGGQWEPVRSETDPAAGTFFGFSVAVDRDRVLIGAPGTSNNGKADQGLVHERSIMDENKRVSLFFSQLPADSALGWSVAARDGRVLAGAPGSVLKPVGARPPGAVVLFEQDKPPVSIMSEGSQDMFGHAVSLGAQRVAVASPDEQSKQGQVGIFKAALEINGVVVADRRKDDDQFGLSISFGDSFLAIGIPGDDEAGSNAGAVRIVDFGP